MTKKDINGFTLAEVLITIGLIGIVAAITIPAIVVNYQKKVYTTKLIQTHSLLTQGFRAYLFKDALSSLAQTEGWIDLSNSTVSTCDPANFGSNKDCINFFNKITNIFDGANLKKTGTIKYKYLSNNGSGTRGPWSILLKNGAILYMGINKNINETSKIQKVNDYGTKLKASAAYIDIDINGIAGPNQWGRDLFEFQLSDDGFVYPEGGMDYSVYRSGNLSIVWNSGHYQWGCEKGKYGWGCGARVLSERAMNY